MNENFEKPKQQEETTSVRLSKSTTVYGGARGALVIVARYGHGDTSSSPGPD